MKGLLVQGEYNSSWQANNPNANNQKNRGEYGLTSIRELGNNWV